MQNKKVVVFAITTTTLKVTVAKFYTSSKFKRVKQVFLLFLKGIALCHQNIANTVNHDPVVKEYIRKEHRNSVKNQNAAVRSGDVDVESIQERRQQKSVAEIHEIVPQKPARYDVPAKERRILVEIAYAVHHRIVRRSEHGDFRDTGQLHSKKRSHSGVSTTF